MYSSYFVFLKHCLSDCKRLKNIEWEVIVNLMESVRLLLQYCDVNLFLMLFYQWKHIWKRTIPVTRSCAGLNNAFSSPPLGGHPDPRSARNCQSMNFFGRWFKILPESVGECPHWQWKWGLTNNHSCNYCGADVQTIENIFIYLFISFS